MWIYDLETLRILAVNDAAIRHYGYTREAFLGLSAGDLYAAPCEPDELRLSVDPGPVGARRHRKRDGTVIQVELIRHGILYAERPAAVVLAHDVTRHLEAESAQRESEDRFRAITEAIPLPMAITRLSDSRVLFANDRFLALFGYTREEAGRRTVMDFVRDEPARMAMREALLRGEAVERSLKVRRADGADLWVHVSMRRMVYQGEPAVIGVAFDDTQRLQAEALLRESEDRFRAVNEAIPQPVVVTRESDNRIVYVNDQFVAFAGLPRQAILGTLARDYYASERDRAALLEGLSRDGCVDGLELQARRPDGTTAWLSVSARRMVYEGSPAILASFFDIGERKRTVEALVAAEAKFRGLVEQALVGTYIIQDGRYQYVNPRMAEIFGCQPRDLLAAAAVLDFVAEGDRPRIAEILRRQLDRDPESGRYTFRVLRRDGTFVDVEAHGARTEFNERPAIIGALIDITERNRAEAALRFRLDFERLVASISARFINLSSERIDEGVQDALRAIGEFAGADRSYVFLRSADGRTVDNTHEWCAPGVPPSRPGLQGVPLTQYPWLAERLLRREAVHIPRVGDLPPEAAAERERFLVDGPDWSLLLVPMVSRGEVTGLLGFDALRTPRRWSEDLVALLDLVGQILVNALERKRADEILRYRLAFESLVSVLSAEFIHLPASAIDDGVRSALRKVGEFMRVDRCYVFRLDPDGTVMRETHAWCAPGIGSRIDPQPSVPVSRFPWLLDRLRRFETIQARVSDLPPEARAEREAFERESVRSLLIIPLRHGDRLEGFLGCDAVRSEMAWTDDTRMLLGMVGQTLVNAFDRQRAEAALRKGERFLEDVFGSIQDGISVLDSGLRVIRVNPIMDRWYAHALPLVGRYCYEVYHGRSSPCEVCPSRRTLQTRQAASDIVPKMGRGGVQEGWLELHTFPLIDAATGEMRGVIEYVRDITERQRAEAALRESTRRLEQAHQQLQENQAQLVQSEKMAALGLLAAGVAHEINNPVGFVMSNLGTLGDYVGIFRRLLEAYEALSAAGSDAEREEARARIDAIRREEDLPYVLKDIDALLRESQDGANRVKEIIQALRSFARADGGERVEVDLVAGIEATIKVVWNEIKYRCSLEKRLAPVPPVYGYAGQLNQVFLNLILNAAQAIPEKGTITVATEAERGRVVVRVADTGVGIPPENLPKLFTPFFTTKPVGKGTGLGLSISYNIVRKHGGTIEVQSEVGKGTTFTVRLPVAEGGHG